jgi:hypothetical protein
MQVKLLDLSSSQVHENQPNPAYVDGNVDSDFGSRLGSLNLPDPTKLSAIKSMESEPNVARSTKFPKGHVQRMLSKKDKQKQLIDAYGFNKSQLSKLAIN